MLRFALLLADEEEDAEPGLPPAAPVLPLPALFCAAVFLIGARAMLRYQRRDGVLWP